MKKITLKIACYEIEDITLKHSSDNQLAYIHIPCDYDTEFCMQLDGWDENTSIPAQLKDKNILLYRHAYDKENHHWILKVAYEMLKRNKKSQINHLSGLGKRLITSRALKSHY